MSSSQCCANPPKLSSISGDGCVQEFGGLKTYVSGSSDSKLGIILISDVFGYEAPSLRKLADKVAVAGFYVVVPDLLHGDPYASNDVEHLPIWIKSHGPDKAAEDAKQVIAALKSKGISAIGAAGFCWGAKVVGNLAKSDDLKAVVMFHPAFVTIDDFYLTTKAPCPIPSSISLPRYCYGFCFFTEVKVPIAVLAAKVDTFAPIELLKQFEEVLSTKSEDKGTEDVKPVIEALKSKGISAIGAAGFCWGGKVVADLAKTAAIKAGVMLHPAVVTVDDIKEVKAPLAILGAEIDNMCPPELMKQFEEVLSTKPEVDAIVKIFPGVTNEAAVKSAEEAHQDMLNWFSKYVK